VKVSDTAVQELQALSLSRLVTPARARIWEKSVVSEQSCRARSFVSGQAKCLSRKIKFTAASRHSSVACQWDKIARLGSHEPVDKK
jgi:hypothetical protein